MRFYVASDIHNEFSVFNFPVLENESEMTLVLAGDIMVARKLVTKGKLKKQHHGFRFFEKIAPRFKHIVYVPGNHEFYGDGSLLTIPDKIRKMTALFPNVHFLYNESVELEGVRFIGSTLWTDYNRGCPMAMMNAGMEMNDYKEIRTGPSANDAYRQNISARDLLCENIKSRKFIESELIDITAKGQKCIVVSHHAPHTMSRSEAFNIGPMDFSYFNTRLEDMILDNPPAFWLHGHTHGKSDYMIGDTRVVCNPRGYSDFPDGYQRQELVFDTGLVFEL